MVTEIGPSLVVGVGMVALDGGSVTTRTDKMLLVLMLLNMSGSK
jgi:hypothetical protein